MLLLKKINSASLETLTLSVSCSLGPAFPLLVRKHIKVTERSGSDILTSEVKYYKFRVSVKAIVSPRFSSATQEWFLTSRQWKNWCERWKEWTRLCQCQWLWSFLAEGVQWSWRKVISMAEGLQEEFCSPACLPACSMSGHADLWQAVLCCESQPQPSSSCSAALRSPAPSSHRSGLSGSKLLSLGPML